MRSALIMLCCLCVVTCWGQTKIVKFGKVSLEELKMTHYAKDSTASAVILYDRGYFNGTEHKFTRHVRLKILKAAGTNAANFTLKTPMKSFIDGYTYNLEHGALQKTKLENAQIYNEEIVHGYDLYKVFFPNVRVGSIVELEYSHDALPFEWRFQENIPVAFNELILEPTRYIAYKKVFYGFEKVKEVKPNHWVAEHIPPVRQEPHMNQYSNFVTRFQFDIESVSVSNWFVSYYKDFSTWEMVGKRLMELQNFGGIVNDSPFLNEKGRELRRSTATPMEKVNEAVKFVRDNIKWNNEVGVVADKSFREEFNRSHSGSGSTINLLLISLLKKAGLTVYPVVLSTRENGMINPLSSSINKLNYVVAYVKHDKLTMLVDAASPHVVPGVLPEHCLNQTGWAIYSDEAGELLDFSPSRGHVQKHFIHIKPKGTELVAEVSRTYEDYAFLEWIKKYEDAGSAAEYEQDVKSQISDVDVTSFTLGAIDKDKLTVTEKMSVSLSNSEYMDDLGNEWLINPYVCSELINPFTSASRQFPIDFIYPRKRSIVISMSLPSGYELKGLPQSSRINAADDRLRFSFLCNASGNVLNIRCDIVIDDNVFTEADHDVIREFHSAVIKKLNESIQVIKRT